MSQDFQKVLVRDDRLNVKDTIKYDVLKSGQNVTSTQFKPDSENNFAHNYSIDIPNQETVVDREVLWTSTVQLKLSGKVDPGEDTAGKPVFLFNYGFTDALAPFPLHSLVNVMQCTINNNTIRQNTSDILPVLTRMMDKKKMSKYNGYTPTTLDNYSDYSLCTGRDNCPLNDYAKVLDNENNPRGSWALDSISATKDAVAGTFDLPSVPNDNTTHDYYVTFTVTEPILMSPFIFGNPSSNNQGIYGITNMHFVMTMGQPNRVWRRAHYGIGGIGRQPPAPAATWVIQNNAIIDNFTVELVNFKNSNLKFNFLTPHSSDLMPSRNVVGFYELPAVRFPQPLTIPGMGNNGASADGLVTSTIKLNQIPDKLIICVKKSHANLTIEDADFFYIIKRLRIDFNNQAGLMSSVSQQELYNMSVENGSNQSWLEFSGKANLAYTGLLKTPAGTTGSLIILKFGTNIPLYEDYYASGSLGNFNLKVSVDIENQTRDETSEFKPIELSIITMNTGVFIAERGTSSICTGLLSKQDVLDASK